MKDDTPPAGHNEELQAARRSSSPFIKILECPIHCSESVRLNSSFQCTHDSKCPDSKIYSFLYSPYGIPRGSSCPVCNILL